MSRIVEIAATGDRFADFGPYVASVDDRGVVHFQATLRDGRTGVFSGDGGTLVTRAAASSSVRSFDSHPDVGARGRLAVYATLADGTTALLVADPDLPPRSIGAFAHVGPLGPTTNDDGAVAFRADDAVHLLRDDALTTLASSAQYASFHGLPAIDARGDVAVRATTRNGRHVLLRIADGVVREVATTGPRFATLGLFPSIDDAGVVAFSATTPDGRPSLLLAARDADPRPVAVDDRFETIRGALVGPAGHLFFFATPRGGSLGVYSAVAQDRPILALGQPYADSTLVDLALNPVSIDRQGRLAARLKLHDGRGLIVRIDDA